MKKAEKLTPTRQAVLECVCARRIELGLFAMAHDPWNRQFREDAEAKRKGTSRDLFDGLV